MAWTAIEGSIWDDEDVLRWPVSTKLLYMFLSTCRECHWMTGIYRPPADRLIRVKTGLTQRQLDRGRARLGSEGKIIEADGWLWLVGKGNHSLINPKVAKGAVNHLADVPLELARGFVGKYREQLAGYGLNGELAAYGSATNSGRSPDGVARRSLAGSDTVSNRVSDTVCPTCNMKHDTCNPKPEHEKTCNPNPNIDARASTSEAGGKSSGSGRLKKGGSESPVFEADAFVRSMEKLLELGQMGRGGRRQYLGDLACLRMVAGHIQAGRLGPVKGALSRCVNTVAEIMADARAADTPEIKRPAAVFQKRIVAALEKRGHFWKEKGAG